nr:LuxR C-terminal-related transcriptional regulator [Acidimicrobiia bacterium]
WRTLAPISRPSDIAVLRPEASTSYPSADPTPAGNSRLLEPLTDRELAVLRLLPTRMTNQRIADELFISINTVKTHLKAIYRKLDAENRNGAVDAAVTMRLV